MNQVPNIPEGKKIVEQTDSHGNKEYVVRDDPLYGCYAVTATFGPRSRELVMVRRRCRYVFLLNPLLTLGWCLYRFYGPLLAGWAHSSPTGASVVRRFVAVPIVTATGKNTVLATAAMAYLFVLSIIGLALFIPTFVITRCAGAA
jgi:hypothetical protein